MKQFVQKYTTKDQNGYTIIELLTVVGILVIISGLIAGILYSTLRGSSKTKISTTVAQNGAYALSVISDSVMSAYTITAINGSPITDCTASPSGKIISLKKSDGSTISFSCANNTIASGSASLIDTSQVKIDTSNLSNCYFYCFQQNPYSIPIVGFGFTLTDKNTSPLLENKSSATFNTSVSLRNYSP